MQISYATFWIYYRTNELSRSIIKYFQMKKVNRHLQLLGLLVILSFMACTEHSQNGRLIIGLTDDPFPIELIDSATIEIFRLEAHPADLDDDEAMVLLSTDTASFDLMKLRNGVVETLVDIEIEAGAYDYLRIYVSEASLTLIEGETFVVKVPSGSTSGIKVKIDPDIVVEGGITSELLLDIDLAGSFVLNGSIDTPAGIKGFNFKPVIRAINISDAGRIEGFVKDTLRVPINAVNLWVNVEDETYSTYSEEDGYYNIIGIPTGIHTLYAFKENYDSVIVENVVVVAGNKTTRDLTLR